MRRVKCLGQPCEYPLPAQSDGYDVRQCPRAKTHPPHLYVWVGREEKPNGK
jgi:hypothetical protein